MGVNKRRRNLLCLAAIISTLSFAPPGKAQLYSTGEDPFRLSWNQIQTSHFQVIFPDDFTSEARRLARLLEFYYPSNSAYLNHQPSKIPVIIHNHSVRSNGYVSWAPKRMELVPAPPATNNAEDYLTHLALHEFRHVVQVDKLNQGITRGLSYVVGQQAFGVTGLMPFWFLEGDATDAETRLSRSGRGRMPSFEMKIKAILSEQGRLFPYEKAYYGSYRDYVPSYYEYGYQMVAHGRNKYGNELWDQMVNYTARKPYTLYPFYFGLKKYAGLSKSKLYQETFTRLGEHWSQEASGRDHTPFTRLNREEKKSYTSYTNPVYAQDGQVITEKTGLGDITRFVMLDSSGREEKIFTPGFRGRERFTLAGNRMVWTEFIRDLRWGRRSFSVLKSLEIGSSQETILSWKTRYFSPDLSPDATKVVVTEVSPGNRYALKILDAETGKVTDSIPSPENSFLQYPTWDHTGRMIYVTGMTAAGKELLRYDAVSETWEQLFNSGFDDMADLSCSANYLWFRGSFSGIDNIYAYEFSTDRIYRVTSSRFGAFSPDVSPNEGFLLYSDYTSQGFNVVETRLDPSTWVLLDDLPPGTEQLNVPSEEEERQVPVYDGEEPLALEVTPFRKHRDLFQFHSWSPFYFDYTDPSVDDIYVMPGISLLSQNKLGTAITTLSYEYRLDKMWPGTHFFHTRFIYRGFFPVIEFGLDYGGDPFVAEPPQDVDPPQQVSANLTYRTKMSLPLNLTSNKMISGMIPSLELSHNRAYFFYEDPRAYRRGMTYLDYRLYGYSYLKTAFRDILPRWGFTGDLRLINTPLESEQIGSQFAGSAVVYVPGFFRHHTLRTRLDVQRQDPGRYLLGNLVSLPRGYAPQTMYQLNKLSINYVMPLAYPDWRIGRLAYFKRIRSNIFYEVAGGLDAEQDDRTFSTAGLDLTTDVHLFHIFFPFNTGVRLMYLPELNRPEWELIFTVDLNQF